MNYKIRRNLLILAIFSILFAGCKKNQLQSQAKINIVTTTFPCYDAVRAVTKNISEKTISVKLLCKPGVEVHSFDPTPQDLISIQQSDLFIFVGGESDEWVEKLLSSGDYNSEKKFLKLFDFVELFDEEETLEKEHNHENEDFENPHEKDEHIWTSPKNEIEIIKIVEQKLSECAKEKNLLELCENFKINAENYIQEIQDVVSFTNKILKETPEKFIVMADRFPFLYFANFYKIEYIAAFSGCSSAVEASTATISTLIDTIKQKKVPAVFYIELGNHKLADTISESCGVKSLLLQSCQNVSKSDFENGETWVSLMKKNALNLKEGLKQWL